MTTSVPKSHVLGGTLVIIIILNILIISIAIIIVCFYNLSSTLQLRNLLISVIFFQTTPINIIHRPPEQPTPTPTAASLTPPLPPHPTPTPTGTHAHYSEVWVVTRTDV